MAIPKYGAAQPICLHALPRRYTRRKDDFVSLHIRYLTNGNKELYTVRNASAYPITFDVFENREDIDERIRHYAPDGEPVFCLPDLARTFGVLDLFYPNHPINLNCSLPKHSSKKCIWESCKHNIDSREPEHGTCPRHGKSA